MPRYIIERNVGEVSQEELETAGKKMGVIVNKSGDDEPTLQICLLGSGTSACKNFLVSPHGQNPTASYRNGLCRIESRISAPDHSIVENAIRV